MTAYNVTGASSMQAGVAEDVSQVLANFNLIAAVLNGNIDNANISPTAAILLSKLAGYPADATKIPDGGGNWRVPTAFTSGLTINVANTDLAFPAAIGNAAVGVAVINTGGGTLRSLGAGAFIGQIITLKSHFAAAAGFTIKGSLGGGTGAQFRNGSGAADIVLGVGDSATFAWDGASLWWEIDRDIGGSSTTILKAPGTTVANTIATTDLFSVTIPANAMGANGLIRITMPAILSVAVGETFNYKILLGGQTVGDWGVGGIGVASFLYNLRLEINANNATNAQYASGHTPSLAGGRSATTTGFTAVQSYHWASADAGTTVDMTAAQILKVQATHSVANAGNSLVTKGALIEVIN